MNQQGALMMSMTLAAGLLAADLVIAAQETPFNRLGTVEFETTCAPEVQQDFSRAVALYHSFALGEARNTFEAIAEQDPACGMAHWGQAMTLLSNPYTWAGITTERLDEAAVALDRAQAAGLGSEREQAFVAAAERFVRGHQTAGHRERLQAFDDAMAELAANHPDDVEASIFSALVTSANFDPEDKSYANQLKAAAVLEPLFEAYPNHPGIAHYLIHSYDYPPIAHLGLEAAVRYADIAPDAPHALHMPSHIFTRVGYWQESIDTNRASATAPAATPGDALHAYGYMVYAHLQLAQDEVAQDIVQRAFALPGMQQFGSAHAYASMPARLALESGNWQKAAGLALQPSADSYPWHRFPHAEAINAFARGVGAARSGDGAAARAEYERLVALRDATERQDPGYWVEQVAIQAEVVRGLAAFADGWVDDGIAILTEAAAREDATEKHVVTPGPIVPAREILADILLETGNGRAALAEFEAVLVKEPNRYRAYRGAMQAAQLVRDNDKSRGYAMELLRLAEAADTQRPELEQARRIVQGG